MTELVERVGLPTGLAALGIGQDDLDAVARMSQAHPGRRGGHRPRRSGPRTRSPPCWPKPADLGPATGRARAEPAPRPVRTGCPADQGRLATADRLGSPRRSASRTRHFWHVGDAVPAATDVAHETAGAAAGAAWLLGRVTIIKINAITVPPESGDELGRRFAARAGAVDQQDGFEGFELLRPTDDRTTWLVVTRWRDEAAFQAWVSSPAFGHGHQGPRPAAGPAESDPAPPAARAPGHDLRAVVVRDRAPGAAQVVCAAAMPTRRGGST